MSYQGKHSTVQTIVAFTFTLGVCVSVVACSKSLDLSTPEATFKSCDARDEGAEWKLEQCLTKEGKRQSIMAVVLAAGIAKAFLDNFDVTEKFGNKEKWAGFDYVLKNHNLDGLIGVEKSEEEANAILDRVDVVTFSKDVRTRIGDLPENQAKQRILKDVTIEGDTATATEIRIKQNGTKRVLKLSFRKVGHDWLMGTSAVTDWGDQDGARDPLEQVLWDACQSPKAVTKNGCVVEVLKEGKLQGCYRSTAGAPFGYLSCNDMCTQWKETHGAKAVVICTSEGSPLEQSPIKRAYEAVKDKHCRAVCKNSDSSYTVDFRADSAMVCKTQCNDHCKDSATRCEYRGQGLGL